MKYIFYINYLKELKRIRECILSELKTLPEGIVKLDSSKGKGEFRIKDGDTWRYVRKQDEKKIRQICQRNYDKKVLKLIDDEIKMLEKIISFKPIVKIADVYEKMNPMRQSLIKPYIVSDKTYLKQWKEQNYEKMICETGYITDNGERVRSKSELIIANKLKQYGITYLYERPLKLNEKIVFSPDFTILEKNTRREIILEHFGMLGDSEYMEKTLRKINIYSAFGYVLGDNLLATFESKAHPLSIQMVDELIRARLL